MAQYTEAQRRAIELFELFNGHDPRGDMVRECAVARRLALEGLHIGSGRFSKITGRTSPLSNDLAPNSYALLLIDGAFISQKGFHLDWTDAMEAHHACPDANPESSAIKFQPVLPFWLGKGGEALVIEEMGLLATLIAADQAKRQAIALGQTAPPSSSRPSHRRI